MPESAPVNTHPKPYHHGNLRAALLETGLELLATRTADDLGLREIARTVGVSANAVYRHFSDKDSLMKALAGEGLQRLYRAQKNAFITAGGGVDGFQATGVAYVQFAVANPALFRQIFSTPPDARLTSPPIMMADAMAFLRDNASHVSSSDDEAEVIAIQAWSLAHGLAMLILDAQIPLDEARISAVFDDWAANLKRKSRLTDISAEMAGAGS